MRRVRPLHGSAQAFVIRQRSNRTNTRTRSLLRDEYSPVLLDHKCASSSLERTKVDLRGDFEKSCLFDKVESRRKSQHRRHRHECYHQHDGRHRHNRSVEAHPDDSSWTSCCCSCCAFKRSGGGPGCDMNVSACFVYGTSALMFRIFTHATCKANTDQLNWTVLLCLLLCFKMSLSFVHRRAPITMTYKKRNITMLFEERTVKK